MKTAKKLDASLFVKAITTAVGLQILGPEMRFQTDLEYDGVIDHAGTLYGNLYIHGGGDPCLGSERTEGSLGWERQIESWVDAVQKLGVKKIEGDVIGDASRWENALGSAELGMGRFRKLLWCRSVCFIFP